MIYLTSDLHFCHDREFLYKPRGFTNIDDMNTAIMNNWNNLITDEDDVYVLGDLVLNDTDKGIEFISQLKGKLHIIRGNHDSDMRIERYKLLPNVVEVCDAKFLRYGKYHFFLTHFPCLTGNLENSHLSEMIINLYGHTHQQTSFFEDRPYMYHVGVDSHNCTPILIDDAIEEMREKVRECIEKL